MSNSLSLDKQDSVEFPSLQYIRQNAQIQDQVQKRIKELQDLANTGTETKVKSQCRGQVDVYVKQRTTWRNEYVLAGTAKERVSYDKLTMGQWMDGFYRIVREKNF